MLNVKVENSFHKLLTIINLETCLNFIRRVWPAIRVPPEHPEVKICILLVHFKVPVVSHIL